MNKNYLFNVLNWNNKYFASKSDINHAAIAGKIIVNKQETTYGAQYTYTTFEGVKICSFYKDGSFGFCTQAYGIEVPNPVIMFPLEAAEHNDWLKKYNLV